MLKFFRRSAGQRQVSEVAATAGRLRGAQPPVHLKTIWLSAFFFILTAVGLCHIVTGSDQPAGIIRLPESDYYRQGTKDFIEATPIPEYRHASAEAYEAFKDMKYGVRIHWGLYSIAGKPHESWTYLPMSFAQKQAYQEQYKTWNPTGFNADEWMKTFAADGLKMFAFTTKHHEGFCMFDTKTRVKSRVNWLAPGGPALEDCDLAYSIMETPFKRDVVKELCTAAHRYGLKIDLYFSNPDWYDADFRPYGYSPITTADATTRQDLYGHCPITAWGGHNVYVTLPNPTPEEEARMNARHRQQLVELLTHYGKIDMMCLDNWFGKENWPATRQTILEMRKLQPDVMLRARGIGNYGDYYTPEGFTPGGKENTDMPWFEIFPLGTSFSYEADAKKYKGGGWIIKTLVDIVSKGGNFMVGIGPDRNGRFHPAAFENLRDAGAWLKVNGEGIYATRPREGDLWKEGNNLRFTASKNHQTIYAFSMVWPGASLKIKSLQPKAGSKVFLMGYKRPLMWSHTPETGTVIQIPAELQSEYNRPCKYVYGFKIQQ
jgi:alpha-L-fucosidase